MSTIQDIQSNIKLNLNYIINADDNFKVIISKIIQKLKDNDVVIKNKGYEILDFKETFSKVSFKIIISHKEEIIEENIVLIISNSNFLNSIASSYKRVIELYLINVFELSFEESSSFNSNDEKITKNQISYLKDKMEDRNVEKLVIELLEDCGASKIEELSKKNTSRILDKIQNRSKRRY